MLEVQRNFLHCCAHVQVMEAEDAHQLVTYLQVPRVPGNSNLIQASGCSMTAHHSAALHTPLQRVINSRQYA